MKYFTVILGLLLISSCAHTSPTSAPDSIVGLWKGTFVRADSGPPQELAFNFISDGPNVGGSMRNETAQGGWIRIENFKMKGDKINFTTLIDTPQGKFKQKYKGRLVDSEIELTAKFERPGSSNNPLRGRGGPSFRYEGRSAGVTESESNEIDRMNPGNLDTSGEGLIQGMKAGESITFTIRKVQ
jgi:hypothetical protein